MNRITPKTGLAYLLTILLICSSCGKPDPNKHVDEGLFEGNTFTSKELGWSLTVPDGWSIVTKRQSEAFEQKGKDAIEDLTGETFDPSGVKDLVSFQKDMFNMFQSSSEPFEEEYEGEWLDSNIFLKQLLYETYQSQGIRVDTSSTKTIEIGGRQFFTYRMDLYKPDVDGILPSQEMFSSYINGMDFGVNINYNNEADRDTMKNALLNSSFKK